MMIFMEFMICLPIKGTVSSAFLALIGRINKLGRWLTDLLPCQLQPMHREQRQIIPTKQIGGIGT